MSATATAPEIRVGDADDTCAYCRRPDGSRVRKAKHTFSKRYRVNGALFDFAFLLCDLCQYARRIFPAWDARQQAILIDVTIRKLRDRYA